MIVLALDTAGTGCFAAVYDSEPQLLLGAAGADIGRGHAERLMGYVEEALVVSATDLAQIERIAVTVGPGSFTGIRVGVSAARGFALALGVPAVGISTLAALAAASRRAHPGRAVVVALDAKRDEMYCQSFDAAGLPSTEPQIVLIEDARSMFSDADAVFCGSGARHLTGDPAQALLPDAVDIALVARLGADADPQEHTPRPLYLRGPDVKPQAGFAIARA